MIWREMLAKSSPLQQIQAQRQVLFYFLFFKKKLSKDYVVVYLFI